MPMYLLKIIAVTVIILYCTAALLLYFFQTRLIFQPTKLSKGYKFKTSPVREEVFLKTADGETVNALFFPGRDTTRALLYFHGNAGDLSGWQFVAEDLLPSGISVLIIDYRGYGKSTGTISESGFYSDAESAYSFLTQIKKIRPESIILYGRSIGTGVATELAVRHHCAGLILESAYTSLGSLANEKLPFFFPSLYLRPGFKNEAKLSKIKCPLVLIHGTDDTLIPPAHSTRLYEKFNGRKALFLLEKGSHNDLHGFADFKNFVTTLQQFFFLDRGYPFHDN